MTRTLELALFFRPPRLGEMNPSGEVDYDGYHRVKIEVGEDGKNINQVVFPTESFIGRYKDVATHVVVFSEDGEVIAFGPIESQNLRVGDTREVRIGPSSVCMEL